MPHVRFGRFRIATVLVVQPERTLMAAAEAGDSELFLANPNRTQPHSLVED